MCVCVCVCVCIYIYIYIYIYVLMYDYIVCIYAYVYVCMYILSSSLSINSNTDSFNTRLLQFHLRNRMFPSTARHRLAARSTRRFSGRMRCLSVALVFRKAILSVRAWHTKPDISATLTTGVFAD